MPEDRRAVAGEMRIIGNAVAGISEEIGELRLAVLERLLAEVLAVELDQIERAQNSCWATICKRAVRRSGRGCALDMFADPDGRGPGISNRRDRGSTETHAKSSASDDGVIAKPIAENVKYRQAAFVDQDGLAIKHA